MKVEELRINNYYQLEKGVLGGGICQIKNGKDLSQAYDLLNDGLLLPIPLTEEWLVKFGFVCHSDGYCHFPTKGISFNDYKSNMINLCVGKHCQEGEYLPHTKHVHQLQNLYFALTGQELTIKNDCHEKAKT